MKRVFLAHRYLLIGIILLTLIVGATFAFLRRNTQDIETPQNIPIVNAKTYMSDESIAKLDDQQKIDQLMRKAADLRSAGNYSGADETLDIVDTLPIEGWEMSYFSERMRLSKLTDDQDGIKLYSDKLHVYLVKAGHISENDPLPDIDGDGL